MNNCGGKAKGLALLNKYKVPVPVWCAIPCGLAHNISSSELDKIIKKFSVGDLVAVRSSADNEDGKEKSFAGMFESKLNVPLDKQSLKKAIDAVASSGKASRVIDYDNATNNVGIVIQKMIQPILAGVAFTKAMDINGSDVVLIEAVSGLGEKLVSGQATPTQIKIPIINGKINDKNISVSGELIASIDKIQKLVKYIQIILDKSKVPLDLEWCIDDNFDVWFVQARPITVPVLIKQKPINSAIPVVGGTVTAPVYIIPEIGAWVDKEVMQKRFSGFPDGAILIAKYTEVNFVPIMKRAAGIITEQGGILSHAAILSRELGIPCIVNYTGILNKFKNGDIITMNGTTGTISGIDTVEHNENAWRDEAWLFDNMQRVPYKSGCVFIEQCISHVNVYAPWVDRGEVNNLDIFIRKKFNVAPNIILAGNSNESKFYTWFENRNHKKLPEYSNSLKMAEMVAKSLSAAKVHRFYQHCINVAKKYADLANLATNAATRLYYTETLIAQYVLLDVIFPRAIVMNYLQMDTAYKLYLSDTTFADLWTKQKIKGIPKKYTDFINAVSSERNDIYPVFQKIYPPISDYWHPDNYDKMFRKALDVLGIDKSKYGFMINTFYDNLNKLKKFLQ